MNETEAIVKLSPMDNMRVATDCAGASREIVLKTAIEIQGRKYVKVEGWQAIAVAHGCIASSRDVEVVEGGYRAIGEVRRISDGVVIAQAEGFVGEDETTWFGGEKWNSQYQRMVEVPKRMDYAIRAMAQTRAISRACRSAFAHVVVMIDKNLSTTPAEEMPRDVEAEVEPAAPCAPKPAAAPTPGPAPAPQPKAPVNAEAPAKLQTWYGVICPIPRKGMKRDEYLKHPDTIGSLYETRELEENRNRLFGFANKWKPEPREVNGKVYQPSAADHSFRKGLDEFLDWHALQPDEDLIIEDREDDDVPF